MLRRFWDFFKGTVDEQMIRSVYPEWVALQEATEAPKEPEYTEAPVIAEIKPKKAKKGKKSPSPSR